MTAPDARTLPLDQTSAERLASRGLRMELVDTADDAAFDAWLRADSRGFHDENPDSDRLRSNREALAYRRTTAILDPERSTPGEPVGTVSSWVTDLTVSPGRSIDAWAISAVTVSPTHMGRGIARAMLEGELRTAAAAGLPLAALTVSEATLYGRYGFAPAVMSADLTIRTDRAKWAGPTPTGRVDLIDAAAWRAGIEELHERIRLTQPGHVEAWPRRWDQLAGIAGEEPERARRLQAASYTDEDGTVRGLLLYKVGGSGDDVLFEHRLTIENLAAETDDAEAALWRLALSMPLVREVTASMRRVDEPVRWQIADYRALTLSPRDNLWLRILDVPAALSARRYDGSGSVVVSVDDPFGFAAGAWRLEVDTDGMPTVAEATDAERESAVSLGVAELSSLYLGGTSAETLARAGRVTGPDAAVRRLDAMLRSAVSPWLPFWF